MFFHADSTTAGWQLHAKEGHKMKSKEWDNVTTSVRSKIETEKELLTEKQWMM